MKEFITELGTAFNADCFEVMKMMPDGCVDMILADLPYGTTACKWDTVIPFEKLWPEFNRICKPNAAMVFTGSQPFTSALVMSNVKNFRCEWIWDKVIPGGMSICKFQPMRQHESVLIFGNGEGKTPYNPIKTKREKPISGYNTKNNITGEKGKDKVARIQTEKNPISILTYRKLYGPDRPIHPTQKPVALFEYLIKTYTNEGDLVFDPTAGSLTTAVAAEALNRRWAVCEMDEGYFDKGVERL